MRFPNLPRLMMLVLALGLVVFPAYAQEQQQSQPGQAQQEAQTMPAPDPASQTFTGKIANVQGEWVLKDDATGTNYKLDKGEELKEYVGQNVRLMGTLDAGSNTIRVSRIELTQPK